MNTVTWVEDALAASTSDECIIICSDSTEANLRWAINALTTNGQMHSRSATVIAIRRVGGVGHPGVMSGPVGTAADLRALVLDADEAALSAPGSEDSADLVDAVVDGDFAAAAEGTSIEVFSNVAEGLGTAFAAAREAGAELYGFAEHRVTTVWLAVSNGTRRRYVDRVGKVEVNAKSIDRTRSAWVGRSTADFRDIDMESLGAEALKRLSWSKNRVDLPAGRYETILPPGAVADLAILAYWHMSGRDAEQGRNVYAGAERGSTRVGENLATLPITMSSDPDALPAPPFAIVGSSTPGLTSVFDNGAPVTETQWLSDGRLANLAYTRAGAARSAIHGFPYPADNLLMDAQSTITVEEMIKTTRRGLLLTCLWYIREVDIESLLVTGLTRDGVYLIEDGEIVAAVNNFRFNESPVDLLRRATEASVAERTLCREWNDWFTVTSMPALRIPDFLMSTVSPAT